MKAMTLHLVMVGLTTGAMVSSTANAAARESFSARRSRAEKMRVGITLLPTPLGVLRASTAGSQTDTASAFAFAVMTSVDFVTRPNVFVGFAASYVLGIKASSAEVDPSQELDLLLRVGCTAPVGRRMHAYGYVAPGYSFVYGIPGGGGAQGLVIGVHGGGRYDLTPSLFLDAQVGYQAGFQRDLYSLMERNERTTFLQVGVGIGVRI